MKDIIYYQVKYIVDIVVQSIDIKNDEKDTINFNDNLCFYFNDRL